MQSSPLVRERSPFWWVRWVPAALLALCILALLISVGHSVLIPLLVSFALTFMLEPLVEWYQRHGLGRRSAVLLALGSFILAVVLVLLFLVPSIWHQLRGVVDRAPAAIQNATARVNSEMEYVKSQLSEDMLRRVNDALNSLQNDPSKITDAATNWLTSGLFGLIDLGSAALGLLIVPFFVFYLLLDLNELRSGLDRRIPERFRGRGAKLFDEIGSVMRGYVRGRFLVAFAMAIIYSTGLFILGVPLWAGIGLIAGLIGIIPYLGVMSGLVLALALAALDGAGFAKLGGVVVVFIVAQLIEDYVLTPRLIGDRLELHPMLVFIALIIAGDMFGLIGLVLAIPVLAVLKVLVQFFDDIYRSSDFYVGPRMLVEVVGASAALIAVEGHARAAHDETDEDEAREELSESVGSE